MSTNSVLTSERSKTYEFVPQTSLNAIVKVENITENIPPGKYQRGRR